MSILALRQRRYGYVPGRVSPHRPIPPLITWHTHEQYTFIVSNNEMSSLISKAPFACFTNYHYHSTTFSCNVTRTRCTKVELTSNNLESVAVTLRTRGILQYLLPIMPCARDLIGQKTRKHTRSHQTRREKQNELDHTRSFTENKRIKSNLTRKKSVEENTDYAGCGEQDKFPPQAKRCGLPVIGEL